MGDAAWNGASGGAALATPVSIANGGTGAASAAAALTALLSGSTIPIGNGGTGQTTANAAINALLSFALAQAATYALSDNVTNTAPVTVVDSHISSGTTAPGFGFAKATDLQSAGGTLRRVSMDLHQLLVATNAAEEAQRVFSLIQGGTLREVIRLGYALNANIPLLGFQGSGNGFIYNSGTLATWISSAQTMQWTNSLITSAVAHTFTSTMSVAGTATFNGRLQQKQGATVASANTLTVGADGCIFPVSGTTTINGIVTTGWNAGALIYLKFAGSLTVTHNSGTPGASAVAIKTTTAANITTAANSIMTLMFDGTFWVQTCPITPGY